MDFSDIPRELNAAVDFHQLGKLDEAESIYNAILAVDPNNFYALNFYGCILRQKGEFNKSIELLSQAVTLQTNSADAFFNLGNAYRSAQRWEEAIPCYETSFQHNDQCPEVLNNLGICFRELRFFSAAENAFQRALSLQPDFVGVWLNLGNIFRDQGRNLDAILAYERLIELNQAFPDAYFALGLVLIEEGEIEKALSSFRKAIDLRPDCADIYSSLGSGLFQYGQIDEAILSYRRAIQLNPESVGAYFDLAYVFQEQNLLEQAIDCYRKAIALNPEYAEAYFNLANILQQKRMCEPSVDCYRKAIDLKPDFDRAYFNLSFYLIRHGRALEALDVLRAGNLNCPNSARLKHLIGTFLVSQGQTEEGRSYLRTVSLEDSSYREKLDGYSLRSSTPEDFWQSCHSNEKLSLSYWQQNPLRSKLASVICSLQGLQSVLECGCNVGANLFAIHSLNSEIRLRGVDINISPIEFGKKKFMELGIDVDMSVLRLQDLGAIDSKSVDVAYTSAVLQHIPREFIPDILSNMIRISRKHVVIWELHGFSPADAYVHNHFIDAMPGLDGRWVHDYWNILESIGVDRNLISAQQLDPKICIGSVSDANCIFSFPVP